MTVVGIVVAVGTAAGSSEAETAAEVETVAAAAEIAAAETVVVVAAADGDGFAKDLHHQKNPFRHHLNGRGSLQNHRRLQLSSSLL